MTLIVVARADDRSALPTDGDVIVHLAGTPAGDDAAPARLALCANRAAARLRAIFPDWLWAWVQARGALTLAVYPGPISWWWYSPLSEMSPIRSPLIRELYWLVLLQELILEHRIDRVIWIGNDRMLADVAREVAVRGGAAFEPRVPDDGTRRRFWIDVARRLRSSVLHLCTCLALRLGGFGSVVRGAADVLLYSRFPVLWEETDSGGKERMFTEWPAFLEERGHSVLFGAAYSGSLGQIAARRASLLRSCRRDGVVLLEAVAPFHALLAAHFDIRFLARYLRWRRRQAPVVFEGLDISALFWREFDANAMSPEVPVDRGLEAGMRALLDRAPTLASVFFPFEYQPMERAVGIASRARGKTVIGLQTGLYTSNQMGFMFPAAQVREQVGDFLRAPLPDAISAYGELPFRVFAERLGAERVLLVGPIRYARLARHTAVSRQEFLERHAIPADKAIVLVTTSTVERESIRILEAVFRALANMPETFLALKFHYHLPLHDEVGRLAERYPQVRNRVYESNLDELLSVASVLVCGGSSTAIEAIARGCMPLVLRAPGDFLPNPILEVPDAAFFWETPHDLARAIAATFRNDAQCTARRERWPKALREQLSPLATDMHARLYALLSERQLIHPPVRPTEADRIHG